MTRFRVVFEYLMVEADEVEAKNAWEASEKVKMGKGRCLEVIEELKNWKVVGVEKVPRGPSAPSP